MAISPLPTTSNVNHMTNKYFQNLTLKSTKIRTRQFKTTFDVANIVYFMKYMSKTTMTAKIMANKIL